MEGPDATPIITINPDSDIMLTDCSGESDGNSDYVELRKNSPMSSDNTPELKGHIQELQQMHKVAKVELGEITQPTDIFTQPNKIDPMDITNEETTPA